MLTVLTLSLVNLPTVMKWWLVVMESFHHRNLISKYDRARWKGGKKSKVNEKIIEPGET